MKADLLVRNISQLATAQGSGPLAMVARCLM